jgi:hypothetical protein
MNAFVYRNGRWPGGIGELEDALDRALGSSGEVTGSGTGPAGGNIDLFIEDDALSDGQVLQLIRNALADDEVPESIWVVIDGRRYPMACAGRRVG